MCTRKMQRISALGWGQAEDVHSAAPSVPMPSGGMLVLMGQRPGGALGQGDREVGLGTQHCARTGHSRSKAATAPAKMIAMASSWPGSQSSHTGILAVSALPMRSRPAFRHSQVSQGAIAAIGLLAASAVQSNDSLLLSTSPDVIPAWGSLLACICRACRVFPVIRSGNG